MSQNFLTSPHKLQNMLPGPLITFSV